jgi:hypothetical protein
MFVQHHLMYVKNVGKCKVSLDLGMYLGILISFQGLLVHNQLKTYALFVC